MYYLAKFCRLCIQTGGKLTDIESRDYDSVTFSEKLKACTEMVISRESLSTEICASCIQKLRISYQFRGMCKKSTSILQRYLTELLSVSDGITADKFLNSELRVTVSTTLPKPRRKRVGKDERCSLLKRLLSKITQEQIVHNIHINGLAKLCEKIPAVIVNKRTHPHIIVPPKSFSEKTQSDKFDKLVHKNKCKAGGLRSLLNFTKNFDFGYNVPEIDSHSKNFDLTPLEQLAKFTETFFYDHFGDYRETILYASDNVDFENSDNEQMFKNYVKHDSVCGMHSKTFIKPEFQIKEEIFIEEPDVNFKKEMFYDEDYNGDEITSDYDFTSRFVQACYDNSEDNVKSESEENVLCQSLSSHYMTQNNRLSEIIPTTIPQAIAYSFNYTDKSHNSDTNFLKPVENSINYCYKKYRTLSPYSVKCRTRGNPFINPQLKKQFQTRNFKCLTCNRRFKSPGYLKAHCSRLKH